MKNWITSKLNLAKLASHQLLSLWQFKSSKPTIVIRHDFISRFTMDKLVCNNYFSWPRFIHIRFDIAPIRQRLVRGNIYDEEALVNLTNISCMWIKVSVQCIIWQWCDVSWNLTTNKQLIIYSNILSTLDKWVRFIKFLLTVIIFINSFQSRSHAILLVLTTGNCRHMQENLR